MRWSVHSAACSASWRETHLVPKNSMDLSKHGTRLRQVLEHVVRKREIERLVVVGDRAVRVQYLLLVEKRIVEHRAIDIDARHEDTWSTNVHVSDRSTTGTKIEDGGSLPRCASISRRNNAASQCDLACG